MPCHNRTRRACKVYVILILEFPYDWRIRNQTILKNAIRICLCVYIYIYLQTKREQVALPELY